MQKPSSFRQEKWIYMKNEESEQNANAGRSVSGAPLIPRTLFRHLPATFDAPLLHVPYTFHTHSIHISKIGVTLFPQGSCHDFYPITYTFLGAETRSRSNQ